MTEQTVERRVVVGVDGSPAARDAVRFAVREAALRSYLTDPEDPDHRHPDGPLTLVAQPIEAELPAGTAAR